VNWRELDEHEFVKLVGELLARLGFVDIDYQGAGPDGGVDLFATELLPFTVQGRVPFRWAIQCKFSAAGASRAVTDAEVRDIEGILRSDRYQVQDPRGYMLVTNRRIAQNVIERLRGVDRASPYRTARLDGSGLVSMLSEHPELFLRYFGGARDLPDSPDRPSVIVPPTHGANKTMAPMIAIKLANPADESVPALAAQALIDTGSSISAIPEEFVEILRLQPVGVISLHTPGGVDEVSRYHVRLQIAPGNEFLVEVVALSVPMVLVGRDMLSKFSVTIRGDGGIELY
jgi:hypothetical protein